MSTILEKQAFEVILGYKASFSANNVISGSPVKKDYNYEITLQNGSEKCKILVYFGKKGVKTVIQGNEYSSLYKLADSLILGKLPINVNNGDPEEPEMYIGTDESGKGDIFGPLVIAAAYIDNNTRNELVKIGVKDSKEIKNGNIPILAEKIKKIIGDNYSIIEFAPPEYNLLYDTYLNLNKLLNFAHSAVIENLLKKVECPTIITDQFSKNPLTISKDPLFAHKKFIQLPKGEKYTAVAAASILARDTFEKWFLLQEERGFFLKKGASKDVERDAKEILAAHGKETLLNLSKNHFKPIKNLILNH